MYELRIVQHPQRGPQYVEAFYMDVPYEEAAKFSWWWRFVFGVWGGIVPHVALFDSDNRNVWEGNHGAPLLKLLEELP